MDDPVMPWSVGIRFSHATLQVLAEDSGVDLLHVKGPAVDQRLTEGERQSIDADVLVRPGHVDRLVDTLHAHGWTTTYRFEDGSAFEHASTLVHPVLAPVDVHRSFPGLDGGEDAFDRLWADRRTAVIAGVPCPVPSLAAQRLLLVLHATRAGALASPDIRRSWDDATEAEREELLALARDVGAEVALAAGTGRLAQFAGRPGHDLWRALSSRETSQARVLVARVRAAPTRRAKVRTAVHLLLPNRRRMETRLGRPPTTREVAAAYFSRSRAGTRELVALLRAAARERRGR
ncbi:nucleotidyltransferase family protein [Rothia sp. ARF10]|nr:nucleotidyltransferase family protein [Rothia sp. ARF10]